MRAVRDHLRRVGAARVDGLEGERLAIDDERHGIDCD
jgi:hypothetical protein